MRSLRLLTAAAVAAATLTAALPAVAGTTSGSSTATRSLWQQATSLRQGIAWHRQMTWHYQDRAGVARTRTEYAERHTSSVPFLRWDDRLWSHRHAVAKHLAARERASGLPFTNDWQTAVRIVQRDWPGSSPWLLSCSSSEGGWGGWVMNTQGSGAGGWMQYMSGTFYGDLRGALALARSEHLPTPPRSADVWSSPLGQAFAAGWAYYHSRPPGKWTGARC